MMRAAGLVTLCALAAGPARSFEYFEHKAIGDAACKLVWEPRSQCDHLPGSELLSIGDVVALADHYADCSADDCDDLSNEAREILEGRPKRNQQVDEADAFVPRRYNRLARILSTVKAQRAEAGRWLAQFHQSRTIDDVIDEDVTALSGGAIDDDTIDRISEIDDGFVGQDLDDAILAEVTRETKAGVPLELLEEVLKPLDRARATPPPCYQASQQEIELFSALPSYLALARSNHDHFGERALLRYRKLHQDALRLAGASSEGRKTALRTEAFALHFLTDLFAAGHVRTDREALGPSDSKTQHDYDGRRGLAVRLIHQHAAGRQHQISWVAYGDGCALGEAATPDRRLAIAFAALSLKEVADVVPGAKPIAGSDAAGARFRFYRPVAIPISILNPPPPPPPRESFHVGVFAVPTFSMELAQGGSGSASRHLNGSTAFEVDLRYQTPIDVDPRVAFAVDPDGRVLAQMGATLVPFAIEVSLVSQMLPRFGIGADLGSRVPLPLFPPMSVAFFYRFRFLGVPNAQLPFVAGLLVGVGVDFDISARR